MGNWSLVGTTHCVRRTPDWDSWRRHTGQNSAETHAGAAGDVLCQLGFLTILLTLYEQTAHGERWTWDEDQQVLGKKRTSIQIL